MSEKCVCCLARADDGETAALVICRMLKTGVDAEQLLAELCLEHARRIWPVTVVK